VRALKPGGLRLRLCLLLCAAAATAGAAPLDKTPDTLIERAEMLRDARDLPWDPAAGRLGNLRSVSIVAPGCTVRIVSGAENRLYLGRGSVAVTDRFLRRDAEGRQRYPERNLTITTSTTAASAVPRIGDPAGPVCLTLSVATAHEFLLGGDGMRVVFDGLSQPAVRIFLNPSDGLALWFRDVRLGLLSLSSNAPARAGGTGEVEWLQLASSNGSTALLFHEMKARHVGVSATTTGARFSIRIGPGTDAGYYQPAAAPGDLARRYPIWIDGPVDALEVPAGRVDAMPLGIALREEARAIRDHVLGRAGPMPSLPGPDLPGTVAPAAADPVSARQRVADVLAPFLPPGVTLGTVDLRRGGAALVGRAPDEAAVQRLVQELNASGEVRNAQVAFTQRNDAALNYRVLVSFMCKAPGERSVCLPGASGGYTRQQVGDALRPILGTDVMLDRLTLSASVRYGATVELEGRASDTETAALLERLSTQVPWLEMSNAITGNGSFRTQLRMVCAVPPRPGGICVLDAGRQ
jgi:hypothetical protein